MQNIKTESEKLFDHYRENNLYPCVNKDLIKRILDIKMNDFNNEENKIALEQYITYLEELKTLDQNKLKHYLTVLKNTDIMDNQHLEKEDSFLINLFLQSEKKHAIDDTLKISKLDERSLLNIHGTLLEGTSSTSLDNYNYRSNNDCFIGYFENGQRVIEFLPLDYKEIRESMQYFFDYYNQNDSTLNLFFKPFLVHAMIASLQVFQDGNSRLGRLLQNSKIYKQTKEHLMKDLKNPAIYITKAYVPQYRQYRELIQKIAVDPSYENVNNWITFNLRKTEDSLYCGSQNLEKIKMLKN